MEFQIRNQRLYIDGKPLSLFSGAFHYWRVDPGSWGTCLDRLRDMGLDVVETYVPWSVHELPGGTFDFGKTDRARDLPGFLRLCGEGGFKVLLRPGPHINAELTYFGYPERLFADGDLAMRCADGSPAVVPAPPRMFPAPCYHNPRFLSEASEWLAAAGEVVRGWIHPAGPVIGIQVDNECSRFFRTHPFDNDYSADSIRLFHRFLADKYGTLPELERAWGVSLKSWTMADPPRRASASSPGDLVRVMDWTEYGDYYILEALRNIAAMIRDSFGEGVPLFHNFPGVTPVPPFDTTRAEEFLDFQGIDSYPRRESYHTLRLGCKATSTMSRLPQLVEFSSGGPFFAPFISLADQRFTTRAVLMHGIRGINFFMAVDRERWYGSPIRRDGSVRPDRFTFYRELLAEVRSWGLDEMNPHRPVLLLLPRSYERLATAASVPLPIDSVVTELAGGPELAAELTVGESTFGLSEPVAALYVRTKTFWYWALTAAGAHFAVADSSAVAELLARYHVVVCPTFELMELSLQEKLAAYAEAGGTLVIGPRAPRRDGLLRPCDILATHLREPAGVRRDADLFGTTIPELCLFRDAGTEAPQYRAEVGAGSAVHLGIVPPGVHSLEAAEPFAPLVDTILRAGGVEPEFVPTDRRADAAVWKGEGRTVLLVANPTGGKIECDIVHTGAGDYRERRTGRSVGGGGTLHVSLEPYAILALERD